MSGHRTLDDLEIGWRIQEIRDPGSSGAIPPESGMVNLVSTGAETRTLAAPSSMGIMLLINMQTAGGDITLTCASFFNGIANNTVVFASVGDSVMLISVRDGSSFRWSLFSPDPNDIVAGPVISTV